jgi:tetratricopeptide (TPR) repeat protein
MRTLEIVLAGALAFAPSAASATNAHALLGDGVNLVVHGRYAEAQPLLERALARDPSLVEAHYNLAVALHEQGMHDLAIAEYRAALRLYAPGDEPNRSKCLYGIALAAESAGDPAAAARAWQDYLAFARPYRAEQPAVTIATQHLVDNQRLAGLKTIPGTQKATR